MTKLSEKGVEDGSVWEASKIADKDQVIRFLEQCVQGGFLYRRVSQTITYRFVHDMIQQAALSLIEDDKLKLLQFTMGKALVENLRTEQAERNLFLTVDFLNYGINLKNLAQNRSLLVDLNLQAGKKALQSSAFEAAAKYLSLSVELLGHDCWDDKNYPTTLEVFSTAAQAEYCNGNLDQCETYVNGVLAQTERPVQDKIPSYITLIDVYNVREQHEMALSTSLAALRMLGANFPNRLLTLATISSMLTTQHMLRNMDETKLLSLPLMTNQTKLMAMKLMDIALDANYMLNSPYLALIEFKMIRWTLKYGVCPQSAVAFGVFGLILIGSMGELKRARVFGKVADELSKRPGFQDTRSRILMQTNYYVFHWTSPIQSCLKPLLLGYEVGMKIGDLQNAFFNAYLYDKLALSAGRALNLVEANLVEFTAQMKIYSQDTIYNMCLPQWQFVRNMTAESAPDPPILSGDIMNYDEMMKQTNHVYLQDVTRMNQLQLAFYFGEYQLAWKVVEASKDFEKTNIAHVTVWRRQFFIGMTAFSLAQSTNREGFWKQKGSQAIARLKKWIAGGNLNCIHLVRLLEAEEQALQKENVPDKVLPLFEKAISTASRAGFIHDRVRDYLELATAVYAEWGAFAKVDHLKRKWAIEEQAPNTVSDAGVKRFSLRDGAISTSTVSSCEEG